MTLASTPCRLTARTASQTNDACPSPGQRGNAVVSTQTLTLHSPDLTRRGHTSQARHQPHAWQPGPEGICLSAKALPPRHAHLALSLTNDYSLTIQIVLSVLARPVANKE